MEQLPSPQVRIDFLNRQWTSSLVLGVITCPPERLNFPASACALKRAAWLLRGRGVFHNGLKVGGEQGRALPLRGNGTLTKGQEGPRALEVGAQVYSGPVAGGQRCECHYLDSLRLTASSDMPAIENVTRGEREGGL